jgi:ribosomal protein S7
MYHVVQTYFVWTAFDQQVQQKQEGRGVRVLQSLLQNVQPRIDVICVAVRVHAEKLAHVAYRFTVFQLRSRRYALQLIFNVTG